MGCFVEVLIRVPEFKHILNVDEGSSILSFLKRDESWIWRFVEESKIHVYLLKGMLVGSK